VHWTANFDEIQDFEHDIRNAFLGTGFMTTRSSTPARATRRWATPKAGHQPGPRRARRPT
jgi:hypothetical protein